MISQLSNYWWVFIPLGVCAGLVSGTLGLGSGTVLIPTLVLLCGFGQKSAQGTALAVMVPMALVGALRYWKNPDIEMNMAIIAFIVVGALAGTLAGTELAARLSSHTLRKIFAIFLTIVAVRMFTISPRPKQPDPIDNPANHNNINLVEPGGTKSEAAEQ
jgi:hypothetical protein